MRQLSTLSIFTLGLIFLIAGCGPATYTGKSNFENTLIKGHNRLAVLPFQVGTDTQPNDGFASQSLDYNNKQLGYTAQKSVYIACLDQFGKKRYNVDFQDILTTGELLRKNRIQYEDLVGQRKDYLSSMLNVDAVIMGEIHSEKPLIDESETKAADTRRAFPNKTTAVLRIYSQRDGQLVWDYTYSTPTVIGNNIQSVTKALMANISLKFPYMKK